MLVLWNTDPFLRILPRDILEVLAFEREAALTKCDLTILVIILAYLRN